MPRLIINADDLGVNAQRSHGIFHCFEFGVLTSATIVANGSDSHKAARHAREKNLPIGLHLNLTEEYPLSNAIDVPTLIDGNGAFHGRENFLRMLAAGETERTSMEREIRAQIEWIFDAYGPPTHIDSHHNIHIHPSIPEILIPILERYGIRLVRIPLEIPLPPFGYVISEEQIERTRKVNDLAAAARELYSAHGINSTDHFRGLTLAGNASLKNMRHMINRLPEGTTELMVHPGSPAAYGTPFDLDPQRQTELRMLTDPSIKQLLAEKKITLCSYADL